MRLPVLAAVAVLEPDERGEVVLGGAKHRNRGLFLCLWLDSILVVGCGKRYYPLNCKWVLILFVKNNPLLRCLPGAGVGSRVRAG